jgi:hypothetical protein
VSSVKDRNLEGRLTLLVVEIVVIQPGLFRLKIGMTGDLGGRQRGFAEKGQMAAEREEVPIQALSQEL